MSTKLGQYISQRLAQKERNIGDGNGNNTIAVIVQIYTALTIVLHCGCFKKPNCCL